MKQYWSILIFVCLCTLVFSQPDKNLDLESAILKQRTLLAPEDLSGIQWVSDDNFAHYGENGTLVIKNSKGSVISVVGPNDLNTSFKAIGVDSVKKVRPIEWKDHETFYLKVGHQFFTFNYSSGHLAQTASIDQKANNITLSPESGFVAYTIDNNIFVGTSLEPKIPVTTHENDSGISAGVAIHRSEFGITNGLFWSDDGLKLGFYEMDENMVTQYPLADYSSTPATLKNIRYPMAGQASHHAKVGVFHVSEKELVYLKTGEPLEQYLTNFTFSPDGKWAYLAIVNRGQDHMKLKQFSSASGMMERVLFEEKDEKYVEPEHAPYFLPDTSFIWFSERDGYNQLFHYSKDGVLIKKLTEELFDIKSIICTTENGKSIIVKSADGLMDEAVYNVNVKSGKQLRLDDRLGTYTVYASDNSNLLIKYRSYEVPNELKNVSPKGKTTSMLLNADNPFENWNIGDVDFPVLTANDGTELQGRLIKPYNFDSTAAYPVLVYLYGGPHAQMVRNDYKGGAPMWMYEAANRGYLIFTVDGRGSANRGIEFEQATFRNLGTVELEDQLTGVDFLKSLPFADTENMAIHGWSYGGFMTISMMLRNPEVFKVGVAGGPVTDWDLYEIMYGERYMDTPAENPDGYSMADLKNHAMNLKGDLLMIHGLDDNVVVPQHSYTLIEKFVDEGKQIDFFVYPSHKHNVRGKDRVNLMEKVLSYIDDHLLNGGK